MRILKFGGTSVGTPDAINQVVQILCDYYHRGERFAVVFSAFSKVTDTLIEMANRAGVGDAGYRDLFDQVRARHFDAIEQLLEPANQTQPVQQIEANFEALGNVLQGIFLLHEVSPRSLDFVVSFGERNAAFIIAHALQQAGLPAQFLDARTVIRTDDQFGGAKVDFDETTPRIRAHFEAHPQVQVVTGFIGSTADDLTTTLGRGGSDYTAAIFGAALHAEAIEIWTDVDGVLTADPRRVKKAFTLPSMTFREAMEMSHFGAKVIYPPTILPALALKIPLVIKNTFNPGFPGTVVSTQVDEKAHPVKGISSINQICLLTLQGGGLFGVPGIAARLFGAMARAEVNVVIITQGSSESSITFAVSPAQAAQAKKAAEKEFTYELREGLVEPLKIERDLSVVAIVGEGMRYLPGISGRLFQALGKNGINVVAIAQGSSELNISVVVPAADETKALNAIHEAFFLSETKTIHLFVVGVGLIGGTLLEQIQQQAEFLREKRGLELKIAGLANSRKMLFAEGGIDLKNWKTNLEGKADSFSLSRFIAQMKQLNLPNAIFLDNTASEEVSGFYEQILDASISISTPNKLAASSPYLHYQRLKRLAEKRGVHWRYETNVGAGLPIISTLNDLIQSGDRILKIEGILSGTLSYIFNNFSENTRFSEVVRTAMAKGLTEPDPRDDLSGADVRRKLLILARETGLPLEAGDVQLQPILPQACLDAPGVDAFFDALEKHDAGFEKQRAKAAAAGQVLRFVAKLEDGKATISLQPFGPEHPFYFLDGSDNMVVFSTVRYHERPLVVRGPGAGAEVTAAGVFAEVIGIGSIS
ncbi:MAG: bifunctional aspartate kinase/homoserine dehydrogenase I [Lewinellaceae bacterium]|nr:bifunctional aspartate kinase/homoserine dehydrogenase I [Lewinellaceae bacterium]